MGLIKGSGKSQKCCTLKLWKTSFFHSHPFLIRKCIMYTQSMKNTQIKSIFFVFVYSPFLCVQAWLIEVSFIKNIAGNANRFEELHYRWRSNEIRFVWVLVNDVAGKRFVQVMTMRCNWNSKVKLFARTRFFCLNWKKRILILNDNPSPLRNINNGRLLLRDEWSFAKSAISIGFFCRNWVYR